MTPGAPVGLVTGAAAGIGRATALALGRNGHRVAIVDVDAEGAEETLRQVREAGSEGSVHLADISVGAAVDRVVAEVVAAYGRIDCLVNNAGVQAFGDVIETTEETWDRTLGINLKGTFLVSKYAMPHLVQARGAIVNVASVQGLASQRRVAAYATSKGALISLSRAMAVDAAPDVRVNCVCPGSVATAFLDNSATVLTGSGERDVNDAPPIPGFGAPVEIADVIVFLCGPRASFMVGSTVVVDGGLTTRIG